MRVWIISESSPPPSFPGITRHYNLAKSLEALGIDTTIVTLNFSHLKKIPILETKKTICDTVLDGIKYKLIRTIRYQKNGLLRLLNMFLFSFRITLIKTDSAPDIIIGSTPSPFTAYAARKLAKKLGIPFILEIRDLWPESLINLANISRINPIILLMEYAELRLYKTSDHILSLLPGVHDYLFRYKYTKNKITYLPNFVNFDAFTILHNTLKNSDKFQLFYSGSLGLANSVETLVEAAAIIQSKGLENIVINIIGDGPNRSKLMAQAKSLQLDNLVFHETVKKSQIYSALQNADAFVILLKNAEVFRWGISPNKLFDYMALAKPIICAIKTDYDLVKQADCGITIPPENAEKLADAIIQLSNTSDLTRAQLGKNGRKFVEEFHNLNNIAKDLVATLKTVHSEF